MSKSTDEKVPDEGGRDLPRVGPGRQAARRQPHPLRQDEPLPDQEGKILKSYSKIQIKNCLLRSPSEVYNSEARTNMT